jgi:sugar-phosphatase
VLVTAEDVPRGKPAPDGYLLAARELGVSPAGCVVVEDSPAGVAAGQASGALVVAVTTTHPADALDAADLVVAGLPEVAEAIGRRRTARGQGA